MAGLYPTRKYTDAARMTALDQDLAAAATRNTLDAECTERTMEDARRVLDHHADALRDAAARVDVNFVRAVDILVALRGRVGFTGVGKSGIVARKLASTFALIGSPSFFLHATDALHGGLGTVTSEDAILVISHSGATEEVLALLPHLRRRSVFTLGILGNPLSPIGANVDIVLDASTREACSFDLVPTTSSIVALALGDALALGVMHARGIGVEELVLHHPAGRVGGLSRDASRGAPDPLSIVWPLSGSRSR